MIYMRLVRAGEIIGYGRVLLLDDTVPFMQYAKPDDLEDWSYDYRPDHADTIERGIEVREGEVWYEGDRFEYDGHPGTLKWNNEWGMFCLVWDDHPDHRVSFWFDDTRLNRIGNIHEGEQP